MLKLYVNAKKKTSERRENSKIHYMINYFLLINITGVNMLVCVKVGMSCMSLKLVEKVGKTYISKTKYYTECKTHCALYNK